jgi:uncharacterized protein (TIGR03067 family)
MTRFAAFVLLAALTMVAVGCGQNKSDPAADETARLQGEWVVEKVERLPESNWPKDDELKNAVITVEGKLAALTGAGQANGHVRFALDATKSPKWADFTEVNEKGEPVSQVKGGAGPQDPPAEGFRAIYRLDGDRLVVAVNPPGIPRPTDFNVADPKKDTSGKDVGAVVVIHLKKK